MASQLGSLFTPGYDSTMQGLIGDENADQARGQQFMQQAQNRQLAQQELQQRENASLRENEMASRGMAMSQEENERRRMHDLMRDKTGFEQGMEIERVSSENRMKSDQQQNEFQAAESDLARKHLDSRYREQEKSALRISLIQEKAEEARLNGDYEAAKKFDAEEMSLKDQAAKNASLISVAQQSQGKTRSQMDRTISLIGQKLGETARGYESSLSQIQNAMAQNYGRLAADRKEQSVQKYKEYQAQRDAELYETPFLRAVSPSLEGMQNVEGAQYLKFDASSSKGGNIFAALNPYRTTSDYGVAGVMDAAEMESYISDHISTSTLDMLDQMGIKGIDRTAGAEAIKAAMQGRPEAEVISLVQKAKLDPVMFKGVFDQLSRISDSEATGGDMKRAREQLEAARAASPGQDSLEIKAAEANIQAIKTYGTLYRKGARSLTNVTDLPSIKAMIQAIARAKETGDTSGLIGMDMSRVLGDSPELIEGLTSGRANELRDTENIARLGISQSDLAMRQQDAKRRRSRSDIEGDVRAARVRSTGFQGLLDERQ
jgi:hypothetical protein